MKEVLISHRLSPDRQDVWLLVNRMLWRDNYIEIDLGNKTKRVYTPDHLQAQKGVIVVCPVSHDKHVVIRRWSQKQKQSEKSCLPFDTPEFQEVNRIRCV